MHLVEEYHEALLKNLVWKQFSVNAFAITTGTMYKCFEQWENMQPFQKPICCNQCTFKVIGKNMVFHHANLKSVHHDIKNIDKPAFQFFL